MQTNATAGYIIFAAACAMMLGLLSVDVSKLSNWSQVYSPGFVASLMGHVAVVLTSFVGGKLVPENRVGKQTRSTDASATRMDSGPKP